MKCTRCLSASEGDCIIRGKVYPLCRSCAQPVVAHITSAPTMTAEAISTPFPVVSRGKVFQVMACGEAWHPSFWSFSDELETRELWWDIKPGDVVADVGADFGSYALSALAQGAAHVFAWSPPFKVPGVPIECDTLARSAHLNGWGDRLALFASGLWSVPGWLACRDWQEGSAYFPTEAEASAHGGIVFPVTTLDALNLQKLDFWKTDVEGAELDVFRGGLETIKRCRPKMLFENHVHIDPDCEAKCIEFLRGLGYRHVGTRPHHSISHTLMVPE
jgi:FkbM family methyltransferase